jgi:hypothetical protein
MPSSQPRLTTLAALVGLSLFVIGSALLVFPHLPATTESHHAYATVQVPIGWSVGLLAVGAAVMLTARNWER